MDGRQSAARSGGAVEIGTASVAEDRTAGSVREHRYAKANLNQELSNES